MKLKKIASLMLAGIMAVSMLAGCKGENNNNNGDNGGDPVPPATGVSATVYNELSPEAQRNATFADSSELNSALQKVVDDYVSGTDALTAYTQGVTVDNTVMQKLADALKCKQNIGVPTFANNTDKGVTGVYVVSAGQDMSDTAILEQVAAKIDNAIETNPVSGAKDGKNYKYDYTMSVSVAEKTATGAMGVERTVKYVAVMVKSTAVEI